MNWPKQTAKRAGPAARAQRRPKANNAAEPPRGEGQQAALPRSQVRIVMRSVFVFGCALSNKSARRADVVSEVVHDFLVAMNTFVHISMAFRWARWYDHKMLRYRQAVPDDLKDVCKFTDWWLSGRGKAKGAAGAVNDCFVSPSQHRKYICKYTTWLCCHDTYIVGWAVVEPSLTMIHLLVAGDYRGCGIGSRLVKILSPRSVRSKLDQSSGNPIGFYKKLGYRKVKRVRSRSRLDIDSICPTRRPNIDILKFVG